MTICVLREKFNAGKEMPWQKVTGRFCEGAVVKEPSQLVGLRCRCVVW